MYGEWKRIPGGLRLWAQGYFVSTFGWNEAMIRKFSRNQEPEYRRLDPMNLWRGLPPSGRPKNRGRVSDPL